MTFFQAVKISFSEISDYLSKGHRRPLRSRVGVEILKVAGEIGDFPMPERLEAETVSNAAFRVSRRLSEGDRATNRTIDRKDISKIHDKAHVVNHVANFFVYIKALGIEINQAFIFTL